MFVVYENGHKYTPAQAGAAYLRQGEKFYTIAAIYLKKIENEKYC